MTKKVHITGADDYAEFVIGIASDERIWKLCFEINKALKINMLEKGSAPAAPPPENDPDRPDPGPLFEADELYSVKRPLRYYEDLNSVRGREFALFATVLTDLPKTLKAFRYFLLLRAIDPPIPDLLPLVEQLNTLPAIRSAVDISHVKNIKSLIP